MFSAADWDHSRRADGDFWCLNQVSAASVVQQNAAALFDCEAPELFCGTTTLHLTLQTWRMKSSSEPTFSDTAVTWIFIVSCSVLTDLHLNNQIVQFGEFFCFPFKQNWNCDRCRKCFYNWSESCWTCCCHFVSWLKRTMSLFMCASCRRSSQRWRDWSCSWWRWRSRRRSTVTPSGNSNRWWHVAAITTTAADPRAVTALHILHLWSCVWER